MKVNNADHRLPVPGGSRSPQEDGGRFSPDSPQDVSAGNQPLVFHYNRDHRLARASEAVRRTYTEGYTPNKGFLKGLTANAGLRSVLAVILILCAAIALVSVFGAPADSGNFHGLPVRLRAFSFGDRLMISLSFAETASPPENFPAMLFAGTDVLDENGNPLASGSLSGFYAGSELVLRQSVPDPGGASVSAAVSFLEPPSEALAAPLVLTAEIVRE